MLLWKQCRIYVAVHPKLRRVQEVLVRAAGAGSAGVDSTALTELAAQWKGRWPSARQPSAGATLTVICARDILLQALSKEATRHSSMLSHEVCRTDSHNLLQGAFAFHQ